MKKTVLLLALQGQNHLFVIKDTAAHVVDNYLRLLNFEALPQDSTLYLETTITFPGIADTFIMRRWHTRPQSFRVEVWHKDTLQTGLCTNGSARYRDYDPKSRLWNDLTPDRFHSLFAPYDFRGPLYNWRNNGVQLTWKGTTDYNGHPLQVVEVESPGMYNRYYMFDPTNGLLTLIIETDSLGPDFNPNPMTRIEWKVMHEYLPLHESLIPSLESFLRGSTLTILATEHRLLEHDILIFNRD